MLIGTFEPTKTTDISIEQQKKETKTTKLYFVETINRNYHSGYTYEFQTELPNFSRSGRYYSDSSQNPLLASLEIKSTTSSPAIGFGRFGGTFTESDDEDYSAVNEHNDTDEYNEQLSTTSETRVPTLGWGPYDPVKVEPEQEVENTDGHSKDDNEQPDINYNTKLFQRKIIISNNQNMPSKDINFHITTDMTTNFEGCFCDQQHTNSNVSEKPTPTPSEQSNITTRCLNDSNDLGQRIYCFCIGPTVQVIPKFSCSVFRM